MSDSSATTMCITRPHSELWLMEGWRWVTPPPITTRHVDELCTKLYTRVVSPEFFI